MHQSKSVDWVAVDWGTSQLRLWMMQADGTVLDSRTSDKGMGQLTPTQFEPALTELLGDLPTDRRIPVICCGMVGAKQGWTEAPYVEVPCKAPGPAEAVRLKTARFDVFILPGVKQSRQPDVMRGEETQIAGFLAVEPEFDGILCLPGTHTKWAHISAQEIVSFRTFMTGELFDLVSKQSVLRHTVQADGWDQSTFEEAVSDAMARPADISAKLFALRAESLLQSLPAHIAKSRLSGFLIGLELAAARPYWLGQEVVLIGNAAFSNAYKSALDAQFVQTRLADAQTITLQGLQAAYTALRNS